MCLKMRLDMQWTSENHMQVNRPVPWMIWVYELDQLIGLEKEAAPFD